MKEMKICKCGKIHLIPEEKIDNALEKNKNFIIICADCGHGFVIGADIESDWNEPEKICYMMYSFDLSNYQNKSITKDNFETTEEEKGIEEIYYSHGIKVPMMTGNYASDYFGERFYDWRYPDFYKIERNNTTEKEIVDFINKWEKDLGIVDMKRFVRENKEEDLKEISKYLIEGFNWKGTKFEREWD